MAEDRSNDETERINESRVSRFGRVVKEPKQYETVPLRGRVPRYGKWTLKDKKKLLDCLKRNECVYSNADFVYKSIGSKQRQHVDEYLKRLRRKAAYHSDILRRKQPAILTWFQVADELTWMKADEELFQAIGTMLNIYCVEANNMQERNKTLSFGNLYRYVKALQKEEKLPELTPAESVVLLDCFQHLAETLRTCDCEAQGEFMRAQYQQYFRLLYKTPAPQKKPRKQRNSSKEKTDKGKKKSSKKMTGTPKATQNTGQRPVMKAQLTKKKDKKKSRRKQKGGEIGESLAEDQGQSSSQHQTEQREQDSPHQETETAHQVSLTVAENETGATEWAVGKDVMAGEIRTSDEVRLPSRTPDSQTGSVLEQVLDQSDQPEDLDPDSPNFLARFASTFSLGSLNPFEIPADLLYLRKKKHWSEEPVSVENSAVEVEDATVSPHESDGSILSEEEEQGEEEDEDWVLVEERDEEGAEDGNEERVGEEDGEESGQQDGNIIEEDLTRESTGS